MGLKKLAYWRSVDQLAHRSTVEFRSHITTTKLDYGESVAAEEGARHTACAQEDARHSKQTVWLLHFRACQLMPAMRMALSTHPFSACKTPATSFSSTPRHLIFRSWMPSAPVRECVFPLLQPPLNKLFIPRPRPEWVPQVDRAFEERTGQHFDATAPFVDALCQSVGDQEEQKPLKTETIAERKVKRKEKHEARLAEAIKACTLHFSL